MIWAQGLSRAFGSSVAVEAIDLDVRQGEIFGFLGPNGAGKSTTIRMLTTLLRPGSGEARVAGFDPVTQAIQVRRRIGYLPDELPVYPQRTANEYLRLFAHLHGIPRQQTPGKIRDVLGRVGLLDVRGKPVGRYSKGMKQRLGLARALLADPEVVFLDEPASGLDPIGRREIRDLIRAIARGGATVFLCSHDLAEVQDLCGRVAIIRQGHIVRQLDVNGRHVVRLEVDGNLAALRPALDRLRHLATASRRGNQIRLEFTGPAKLQDVARAVQQSGLTLLAMHQERVDLEQVYHKAMEAPA